MDLVCATCKRHIEQPADEPAAKAPKLESSIPMEPATDKIVETSATKMDVDEPNVVATTEESKDAAVEDSAIEQATVKDAVAEDVVKDAVAEDVVKETSTPAANDDADIDITGSWTMVNAEAVQATANSKLVGLDCKAAADCSTQSNDPIPIIVEPAKTLIASPPGADAATSVSVPTSVDEPIEATGADEPAEAKGADGDCSTQSTVDLNQSETFRVDIVPFEVPIASM